MIQCLGSPGCGCDFRSAAMKYCPVRELTHMPGCPALSYQSDAQQIYSLSLFPEVSKLLPRSHCHSPDPHMHTRCYSQVEAQKIVFVDNWSDRHLEAGMSCFGSLQYSLTGQSTSRDYFPRSVVGSTESSCLNCYNDCKPSRRTAPLVAKWSD